MVRTNEDEAPEPVAPRMLTITVWTDREPELDTGGLADWIVDSALERIVIARMPTEPEEEE